MSCYCIKNRSHFILRGLKYYVLTSKNKYNVYYRTLVLMLRWDAGEVRGRFGGMGRFKDGLRCKRWINSVITEIKYRCNYMQVFF